MKVSIVTISFNQARFLSQTLASVQEQEQHGVNVEHIICDPGSSDGSRELLLRQKDRVKLDFSPDNGPADGLNKGFKHASGEIFGYINSDDYLLPRALQNVVSVFASNPDVNLIYGHCIIVDATGSVLRKAYSDRFELTACAYGAVSTIQPSTFFRREAFLATNGFNVSNRSNWDGELLIDMVLCGARTLRVSKMLSAYRVHETGITGSGRLAEQHLAHSRRMFQKIMNREQTYNDKKIAELYRLRKHLLNPRATFERMVHGPIFGSVKS